MTMSPRLRRYGPWGAALIAAILLGIYLLQPPTVAVDMAAAVRGPLRVTVDEEGRTRVRDVYVVSAPITGYLRRIELRAGDAVQAAQTVVAAIEPADPSFLDARSRAQTEAALRAAEAALSAARAQRGSAEMQADYAANELERIRRLAEMGAESQARLDRAQLEYRTSQAALAAAESAERMRSAELQTVRALLTSPQSERERRTDESLGVLPLWAPATGRVLRIVRESQGIVTAGTPLLEIGDPADLEIVAELLSADAIRVSDGAAVEIRTGEETPMLEGRVARVEPYGFTKISALGVEEQRVNTIIDLTSPPGDWQRLSHGFRVEVRISVWESDEVLQIPIGALFRSGNRWAIFRNVRGRADLTLVEVGALNSEAAEIREGLMEGDEVVLYPSDSVTDGAPIARRAP